MSDLAKLNRLLTCCGAAVALSAALSAPADAHHSYSMFDHAKTLTIKGTIRTWELTTPHSDLGVMVPKDGAPAEAWGLEGGGIQALMRAGVTKSAIKPGQKVSVDLHPLRDGRTGGMLLKVTLEDGRVIGGGGGNAGGAGRAGGAAAAPGLD